MLMLKVLFTQDSEVENLFCGASSASQPSLLFSSNIFNLRFEPVQIKVVNILQELAKSELKAHPKHQRER